MNLNHDLTINIWNLILKNKMANTQHSTCQIINHLDSKTH